MPEARDRRLGRFTFKHEDGWLAEAVVGKVVAGCSASTIAGAGPSRHGIPGSAILDAAAAFAFALWRRRSVPPKLMYGT